MFSLHQGFLSTPLAYSLRDHNLWKKSKFIVYRERLLWPHLHVHWLRTTGSVIKNCTPLIDISWWEAESSTLQFWPQAERKLRIILLIPAVKDFMLRNFTVWLYTSIKPQSSAPINHTENFWELAGQTQTKPELQGGGELWRNGWVWDLLKPNTAASLKYLIHLCFPHEPCYYQPGVVHSVEAPSPFWMKKQRKAPGCDQSIFSGGGGRTGTCASSAGLTPCHIWPCPYQHKQVASAFKVQSCRGGAGLCMLSTKPGPGFPRELVACPQW